MALDDVGWLDRSVLVIRPDASSACGGLRMTNEIPFGGGSEEESGPIEVEETVIAAFTKVVLDGLSQT